MALLALDGVSKAYAGEAVLTDVTFQIDEGDRVGLVGRNGSGKTTILKIVAGSLEPDSGRVHRSRSIRLGYLAQAPALDPRRTVIEETLTAFERLFAVEAELRALEEALAAAPQDSEEQRKLVVRHDRLMHDFERGGGYNLRGKAEAVLFGLGVGKALLDQPVGSLSGGEKSRVSLAKLLLLEPDILLLDEPTNHLDIEGTEWLESYLTTYPSAFIVVSHDRYFLDRTTSRTLYLRNRRLSSYAGGYTTFLDLLAEEEEARSRAFEKQQEAIEKEEEYIRRFMAGQRSRQAKGRLKRLERMDRLDRPEATDESLHLRLDAERRLGDIAIAAADLTMGYGERKFFEKLSFEVSPGERIGIMGRNGAGKSTLLKILSGREQPLSGKVRRSTAASLGYFEQEQRDLGGSGTPYSVIHDTSPRLTDIMIRSHLARFLFSGDEVFRPLSLLSGGELNRVALARLLLLRPNLLLLDEPTNHLDIPARQALEAAILDFEGTVIVVSHDRYFLDQVATKILTIDDGRASLFIGNYTALRERKEREALEATAAAAAAAAGRKSPPARPAGIAADGGSRPPKLSMKELEKRIIALEEEEKSLSADLAREEIYKDGASVKRIRTRLAEIATDLEALNRDWFERT